MNGLLLVLILVIGAALIVVLAVSSYQRHARRAQAKSQAAWARLQADVDAIVSERERPTAPSVVEPGELPE